jgi:hypothetical protein
MLDEKNILKLHKNSHGDIIFEFNPQNFSITGLIKIFLNLILNIFLPIFAFFDFLASRKKLVISAVGLGIGLGLSVLVTQQPDSLQAFPALITSNAQVRAKRLVISSIDLSSTVEVGNIQDLIGNATQNSLVHDERSAQIGDQEPVVIAEVGVPKILDQLHQVAIGDEIQVYGTNNAIYKYRVTEIRDMKAEYLPNVIGAHQESVIIYKPSNLFRTQLYMVIAKPIK